jgi:hypothetical protein
VSFRPPFAGALARVGGQRPARVPLDPPHEGRPTLRRRPRPQSLIQPPLSPAEKMRGFAAVSPAAWPSPLGMREVARPKSREMAGNSPMARGSSDQSPDSQTGWRSGQSSASRSLRPNSLIYGKIQGIRADSGSSGLAMGPDSLPCTGAYTPLSLPPRTGNFVPRSRDSCGHPIPSQQPRGANRQRMCDRTDTEDAQADSKLSRSMLANEGAGSFRKEASRLLIWYTPRPPSATPAPGSEMPTPGRSRTYQPRAIPRRLRWRSAGAVS